MSKTTELLEAAVAEVIANRPAEGERPSARQRAAVDRAFARVLKIIAPRIRHFIKQYGLTAHWDDAEQVCAIAVHRAIEAYDPEKAMFTTFINWQIRGELQGLRFRLMEDQRPSARKVEAVTISLNNSERGPDGEELSLEAMLEDEGAIARTESAAADHLAQIAAETLMDEYVRHLRAVGTSQLKRKANTGRTVTTRTDGPAHLPKYVHVRGSSIDPVELEKLEDRIRRDREIVARHLFAHPSAEIVENDPVLTKERIRQITRRAARVMTELVARNPRFAGIHDPAVPQEAPSVDSAPSHPIDSVSGPGILPAGGLPFQQRVTVTAPDAAEDENIVSPMLATPTRPSSRLRH
ncbi:sigma-70 family RNA polymerase sigma factor [Sphingobium subterraneum]|uniref:RNA polymerase sigma-32 factor n=1 Tax=Sphingobium subterraneum TaxID=627688 RepID=A0A841J7H0_9SPHN|nr:sigma-70 family RNA polymerase sigma factor [Sphingobium subterraneum]MBB6124131.1 RNA polymerase sigma-32 factor [Sphingobium subterraneum]